MARDTLSQPQAWREASPSRKTARLKRAVSLDLSRAPGRIFRRPSPWSLNYDGDSSGYAKQLRQGSQLGK